MDYELMANEELAVRAKEGDKTAEEVLYGHVRLLIYKMVSPQLKLCRDYGAEEDDVMQQCWIGFHNAVNGYKPGKSLFSSYLTFHIKTACNELRGVRGRPKPRLLTVPLEEPIRGAEDLTIADMIVDESVDVTGGAELTDLQRVVRCAVDTLTEQQQRLIHTVYVDERTLADFAREEGFTRERARQMRNKILRDLRRNPGIRAFAPFYTGRIGDDFKRVELEHWVWLRKDRAEIKSRIDSGVSLYLAWCADNGIVPDEKAQRERLLLWEADRLGFDKTRGKEEGVC